MNKRASQLFCGNPARPRSRIIPALTAYLINKFRTDKNGKYENRCTIYCQNYEQSNIIPKYSYKETTAENALSGNWFERTLEAYGHFSMYFNRI